VSDVSLQSDSRSLFDDVKINHLSGVQVVPNLLKLFSLTDGSLLSIDDRDNLDNNSKVSHRIFIRATHNVNEDFCADRRSVSNLS